MTGSYIVVFLLLHSRWCTFWPWCINTGLGLGLNAVNQIGNDIRDYRQESEIQRTKVDLEMERQRSADLEARMRQLEMNQNQMMLQAK